MLHKFLSLILPLVLIFSFGTTATVLAEPFTPNEYIEVLNLPECNLSISYYTSIWLKSTVAIRDETAHFITSRKDPNVFLRTSCTSAITNMDSTPARVPFWTGATPDSTKTKVVMYGVQKSGNQDGSGALYYVIENKENPSKSISLMYNYNTNDFGSWDDVYNKGLLGIQGEFPNWALQLKYITDPAYSIPVSGPKSLDDITKYENVDNSPKNFTTEKSISASVAQNETVATKTVASKLGEKVAEKVAAFDSKKYISCKGNIGKYLNDKGEVIKASKIPKGSNIIKAEENGTILNNANDYIYCVKNAKPFGVINCQNNLGQAFNSKGKKLSQYTRGTIFYASPEFGNIYTSPKAAVMCTDNQYFLEKIIFQK